MPKNEKIDEAPWPADFESHRREEIIYTALNTTVAQRFSALEEMWETLKPQMSELLKNRWARIDREEAERIARIQKK